MAQLVVAVAGAAVGSLFGAPGIGFAIGSAIGGTLFAPKSPGPRLQDLKATAVEYGATLPLIYGHPRVGGSIVWSSDKIPVKSGGGGKGGPSAPKTITYKQNVLYKLSANECVGVRKIWDAGKLIWTSADDASAESLAASADTDEWEAIEIFTGAAGQDPWSVYEAAVGVGLAPANRGQLTVGITGLNLGQGGYPRQLTFEVARIDLGTSSSVLLDVSLLTDASDASASPITPSITNGGYITYGDPAFITRENTLVSPDGPRVIYSGSKLSSHASTSEWTAECYVGVTDPGPGGTSDTAQFFRISNAGGISAIFSFRVVSSQVVLATAYQNGATFTNFHGAPTSNYYRIVIDPVSDTVQWFNGETLLRTVSGAPDVDTLIIGVTNPSGNWVMTYSMTDVLVYVGAKPGTGTSLAPESLQSILEDMSIRCGLEGGYTDASACAAIEVDALAITQVTPARNVIEGILFPAYGVTCFEDDGLVYVLRGGSSAASPPYEDLGATEGDPSGNPLPITDRASLEVPAQYAITSSNIYDDYQNQTSYSDILSGGNSGVATVELALGLTPQAGKRVADIKIRQEYLARRQIGPVCLTRAWSKLRPTDLITLTDQAGSTFLAVINKITDAGPVRTLDLELDDASVWASTSLVENTDNSSTIVNKIEVTDARYLDIAILRDADNDAGAYVAVAPLGSSGTWPGCIIERGLNDTGYIEQLEIDDRTVLGVTTTILGGWDGLYTSDETNTVTVTLSAAASSYTDDAIINGTAPYWVIGDEVVYVRTATLVTVTTYTLSGIYRARRGTEYATGTHEIGDRVVLMQTSGVRRLPMENGQLGVEFSWKAVTFGKSIATADETPFADMGVGLKPFSPVDLHAADNGDGTYDLTWVRRTRLSCRFTGALGINAPLGEATEAYAVDVFDGVDVTSTQTVTTSAATVTASPGDTARIYQLSSTVGRGFVAELVL